MIIRTEFDRFEGPEDLYDYMLLKNINMCSVECVFFWGRLIPIPMSLEDVKAWIDNYSFMPDDPRELLIWFLNLT